MNIRCLLLVLCFIWVSPNLYAYMQSGEGRYLFTHLTMENGLPQNYVEDLMKDSRGFLWISTGGDGVTRYDGYEFLTFNASSKGVRLKNNFVLKFCEDRFGRIWMVGERGLDVMDVEHLHLVNPQEMGDKFASFNVKSSTFVYCSSTGNIWLGADDSLYKLSFTENGEVEKIVKICDLYLYNRSLAFCEVDGYIWFDYLGRLCRIKESSTVPQQPQPASENLQMNPNGVMLCAFYWQNDLWIGTNHGLYRYNINSDVVKHYQSEESKANTLTQNYITDIALTPDGTLVIATLKGLNLYNAVTDDFTRIQQLDESAFQPIGLNCDFINCLLADENMVWVGTEVGGLSKMLLSRLQIQNNVHSLQEPASLSRNLVNSILEDEDGMLWVGTVEGGLNLRRVGKKGFEHYTTAAPAYLSHNSISALASDAKDRIYVGTWGGGFGWVNRKNLTDRKFHHIPTPDAPGLEQSFIGVLLYDTVNNLLWIGSSKEILTYNPVTGEVLDPFKGKRKEQIVGSLGGCITKNGILWMGTSAGLYRVDLHSHDGGNFEYTLYSHKFDDVSDKLVERVTSVYEGKNGELWVGTNGNGFYQIIDDGKSCSFKPYRVENGLVNNSVRGIWEDNEGHLWITTSNGLSCFFVKEENFQNYTTHDGLAGNQFYWNATGGSRSGVLYAGGTAGLAEIRLLPRAEIVSSFPLVYTRLHSFGKILEADDKKLVMHERDKSLSIDFAALDYNPSALARYSYRLKGFDDKWTVAPMSQHSVTYTNLRPGKYIFQLHYTPDGKNWTVQNDELSIVVQPYFYKTAWFILLVLCILTFTVYRILLWRFRVLKQQKELLHQMVEERTHELEEQKKLLSNQTQELSLQNELLKSQNEKITSQKNKILEMSRKVEELTVDKLSFFTNITHEFRTPLTLIIGPIERALKLSYNPQVIEQLHLVERNSKYLLSLVNQLMDFRKVEEGRMKIVMNQGNLLSFMQELMLPFADYAEGRGITFRLFLHLPKPELMFAEDVMRKVLTNLVSNSLKFTPKGGAVLVYVSTLYTETQEEKLFIGVRDTGKGIPEEDIDRIFNRFYQSDNQTLESVSGQSGTGIGLYLCKKLICSLGGDIYAKNNPKKGSSFRILLPVERSAEVGETIPEENEELSTDLMKNNKMTMLVVEDNKDMRDYIRSILSEYYNVLEASQGEEALQVLKNYDVDFIISDLMMPVMDGVEFLRAVKNDFSISHIPFLMLTAKTSDESRLESYKVGVDAYLLKPFDENLLLARISNILENRKRFQQKFSIDMNTESLNIEEESGDKKFLDKAMKVVKENYKKSDFEVGDFIEAMGISKSLLNKKMQSLTGQSAGQFMRNYRLNLARELLLKNKVSREMNISEIAYEVGFNDPKYFTRCFTKHFNITPSSLMEDQ